MITVKGAIFLLSPFIILSLLIILIRINKLKYKHEKETYTPTNLKEKYKHEKETYTPTNLKEMFNDYQKYSQRTFNLMYYSLQLPKEALIKDRIEREIIWLSMQADNVTDCIKDRMCNP